MSKVAELNVGRSGETTPSFDKEKDTSLEPVESVNQAELIEFNENRNGQFHRSFSPRQVHVSLQQFLESYLVY